MPEDLAAVNIDLKNDYLEQWLPARNRMQRYESFFRGAQYTRKEKKILKSYGLIPIVINIVRPLLSQRRAILTSSKPTWKVVPLQGASKLVADAGQQFLVGKWNADYVDTQLNLALKDMLITGIGYLFVDLANFLDNSIFDINIKRLSWKYVLIDPMAQEFDASDAENILIRKFIGVKRAQVLYNLNEAEAQEVVSDENTYKTGNNASTQQVEVLDRFSKFPVQKYVINPVPGEHLRDLPSVFYTSRLSGKIEDEKRKLQAEMENLAMNEKIQIQRMKELHIHRVISLGKYLAYNGIMNIRDYPVVPFVNEFGNQFIESQGEVEFIEGMQKTENKFYLLTMHNAMLTGNVRYMAAKGAIKNKALFQKTSALPGAVNEYEPDSNLPDGGKPTVIQPGSLPSAFYGLSQDIIEKAKFETNTYGPMLGDDKSTPETFSTASSLQNFGTQTIKELARRTDIMVAKCGEVVMQFVQNYTDKNELLEFIDLETGEVKSPVNETPTEVSPQGNGSSQQQQKEKIILNQVVIKDAVVDQIKNDARIGKFAVKILTQPNLGSDRLVKGAFIRDMVMNKAIPASPSIVAMLMDLLEFPNSGKLTEQIKNDMDAGQKAQQAIKQMEELSRRFKMAETENLKLQKRLELADLKTEIEVMKVELHGAKSSTLEKLERDMNSVIELAKGTVKPKGDENG